MTQSQLILAHLKQGNTLTPWEAREAPFLCMALSQRCGELRREGYPIKSEMIKLPNGKRVAQYSYDWEEETVYIGGVAYG